MARFSRRQVLAAMSAFAAIGAGGATFAVVRWYDRPAGSGRLALSDVEYELVDALAEAWMPPGGVPALSGRDARLAAFVDEVIARMRDPEQGLLKTLLAALDDLPRLGGRGRFAALPLADRIEVLQGWADSSLPDVRAAIRAILALLSEGWTQHPDVVAHLRPGFPCGVGP